MIKHFGLGLALCLGVSFGCGDDDGTSDAGRDGGSDTGTTDASGDVGDGGDDAGGDASGDAGDDAGDDAGADDAGEDAAPPMCGDIVEVASVEDLVALAPASWGREGFDSQWPATADLRATASFSVMGSDFTVPDDCISPSCASTIIARVRNSVPGVTPSGGSIDIESDAVFRMRFNIQFLAPAGDFPVVVFEKACTLDCASEESRCEEDDGCYTTGRQFCRSCDHESAMRCACVGDDGADLPDGTDCTYVTGDIGIAGTCMGGSCGPMSL